MVIKTLNPRVANILANQQHTPEPQPLTGSSFINQNSKHTSTEMQRDTAQLPAFVNVVNQLSAYIPCEHTHIFMDARCARRNLFSRNSQARRTPGEQADSQLSRRDTPWNPALPALVPPMSTQHIWSTEKRHFSKEKLTI